MQERETFGSRLGFLLISAGCAIGLGNVWRFPSVTGQYGGAAFVLLYLIFLVLLALPVMVMEFAVGRASRKSVAGSFQALEPKGSKWHVFSYFAMAGNYLLMMFYTTGGGWMLSYCFKTAAGSLEGLDAEGVRQAFDSLLASPGEMTFWMTLVVLIGFGVCSLGLRGGVERVTKVMMIFLLVFMMVLAIRSVTLPGARAGLEFYLLPDFGKIVEQGLGETIFAAMGQAFFTLSIGMGSMAIFGSYIGKEQSLTGESVRITILDTLVALTAGLILFPRVFPMAYSRTAVRPWSSSPCPTSSTRWREAVSGALCFSCSCPSPRCPPLSPCLKTSFPLASTVGGGAGGNRWRSMCFWCWRSPCPVYWALTSSAVFSPSAPDRLSRIWRISWSVTICFLWVP